MKTNWSTGMKSCPACGGKGIQMNKNGIYVTCPVCMGSGTVSENFGEESEFNITG